MTIQHHPDISTLIAYAAGALGEALSVVVASHLDVCGECRREAMRMNRLGGAIMDASPSEPLASSDAGVVLRGGKVPAQDRPAVPAKHGLPRPLARLLGKPLELIAWKAVAPGVKLYSLPLSPGASGHLALLKVAPGRGIPDHGHGGSELTMVLQGAFRDEHGIYRIGDVEDIDGEHEHQPVVEGEETCICIIASEAKALFKGWAGRLVQPLTGL
ncbi:MAG: transcriptional regulator [Hyphomicrobiaceae bacterium]|nr:MAG: transcriptional regulator [Hyphomicrobiaceae bacterium]